MQILLQSYKAQVLVLLFTWLVSMLSAAAFVTSLSMIGLVALAFFQLHINGPEVRLRWRSSLAGNWHRFLSYRAWPAVTLYFLIVFVSVLWSSDSSYTLERLRIRLPFLVLPFAFAGMPGLKRKEILTILYFTMTMMFFLSVYVFINFLVDYDTILEVLGKGGHLPTPSNHIRFSLAVAFATMAGVVLFFEKFYLRHTAERWLIGLLTLFMIGFTHLLSVRSGIVAVYIGMLTLGIGWIVSKKKYLIGLAGLVLLSGLPLVAYHTLPTFRLKVDYARWDFLQFRQGIGSGYPDSERLTSMQVGLSIAKEHPFIGVGAGDLRREVEGYYQKKLDGKYTLRMPHNQLITVFAGTGVVGLMVFLAAFFIPLFYRRNFRQPLFLAFHVIVFMSLQIENTFENNFGVSLYLFFLLIGLNYLQNSQEASVADE